MVTTEWYVLSLMHYKRLLTSAVACRLPRSPAAVQSEYGRMVQQPGSGLCHLVHVCGLSAPSHSLQLRIERKAGDAALVSMTQNVASRLDVKQRKRAHFMTFLFL